jgi:NTP pyrophosphatase (non-canonical NTP hydrolase)
MTDINEIVRRAHATAVSHGFWDDAPTWEHDDNLSRQILAAKLMLIVSEVAEAVDARDNGDFADAYAEELADIIIRIADLSGYLDITYPIVNLAAPTYTAVEDPLLRIACRLGDVCEDLRHDDVTTVAGHFRQNIDDAFFAARCTTRFGTRIDLWDAVERKMAKNDARPYRHGKKF